MSEPPSRKRMPSINDMPSDLFPEGRMPDQLFRATQAHGRALLKHAEQHRDTAHELRELRQVIKPVADMILRENQKTAVQKHWAAIYAIALPFLCIVASAFVSWYTSRGK